MTKAPHRIIGTPAPSSGFQMSELFPEHDGRRWPFPKQLQVFDWLRSGEVAGGGIVYQGGKGSGKTITGSSIVVWAHHQSQWRGLTSLIGRETYPSLLTSTADEFFQMLEKMPGHFVKGHSRPQRNAMGWVEWTAGGKTLLCSLSNNETWESANLGLVWVDEAHRQNPRIMGDLETRIRQKNAPRVMLCTTNPGGKNFIWDLAHPASPSCRPNWRWIEATSMENPALPEDYKERLIRRYGKDTPAYRRWVLGQSTALEGTVLTEFDDEPKTSLHIVPAVTLPKEWSWGRGLDYGLVNPTAVVWGVTDPAENWWITHTHYAPAKAEDREKWSKVENHAEAILAIDALFGSEPDWCPADPSIWGETRMNTITGELYSIADKFLEAGVMLTPGDNNRESGLSTMIDLFSIDDTRFHPVTLRPGAPRIFIMDRPANLPLIRELSQAEWARPEGTVLQGRPDDIVKKNDHAWDALRYLVQSSPFEYSSDAPDQPAHYREQVGSRGQRRIY